MYRNNLPLMKKYLLVFVFLIQCSIPFIADANPISLPEHIRYLSPLPNSRYVATTSPVIVRLDEKVDAKTIQAGMVSLRGSSGGYREVTIKISDDQRTLIVVPVQPFSNGEEVTVMFPSGVLTASGGNIESFHYSFTVTSISVPREKYASGIDLEIAEAAAFYAASKKARSNPIQYDNQNISSWVTLPKDFPSTTILKEDRQTAGTLYLSNLDYSNTGLYSPYLMVLDQSCNPLFFRKMESNCFDFKPQPNGDYTYWNQGMFWGMDSTFTVKDSYLCMNGISTDAHDLQFLPNGHVLYLGMDVQQLDMSTIVPDGNREAIVLGLVIQEMDGENNIVFQWRSWDHFNITDATYLDLTAATIDYVHANAIELDADGNILLSSRHLDEITKINRETGEIIWRMGGKNNQFTFTNDSSGFSRQHAIRRIANGNVTLYDNGNYHTPQYSRAVEYQLDEVNKTATLVWQYRNTPDYYGPAMGNVQRLHNGNTLINWGATNPSVTEVTTDGTKVFEMTLPEGVYSYRAYKTEKAILQPSSVSANIELPYTFSLQQNYPNPFNPTTTISYQLSAFSFTTLKIYDAIGREVSTLVNEEKDAGTYSVQFNGAKLSSGIYFAKLTSDGKTQIRKLLLMK
jgi:hypothetical protein